MWLELDSFGLFQDCEEASQAATQGKASKENMMKQSQQSLS